RMRVWWVDKEYRGVAGVGAGLDCRTLRQGDVHDVCLRECSHKASPTSTPHHGTAPTAQCYSPSTTDSRADYRGVIALAYRSLVRDTLLPSDPAAIGRAALAGSGISLPRGFGNRVEHDGDWLPRHVTGDGPWWAVIQAMANAVDV